MTVVDRTTPEGLPSLAGALPLVPHDCWGVFPHPDSVRRGTSPVPLFLAPSDAPPGSAFFAAQNAKIALAEATGRRLYVDRYRDYQTRKGGRHGT